MPSAREDRYHKIRAREDQRQAFAIDRDRIQYSSTFHRLAGVTQIVRVGEEGIFHTRQQHTYKVAQVGRRLAEYVSNENPALASKLGISAEVVEAAGLAHDLGHPPFGHAGEYELNRLVEANGDPNGFEGNAQTFRTLTKLSVRFADAYGLNLTRATLAACLKYPWLRNKNREDRSAKWGAYEDDRDDFLFARELHGSSSKQSAEAALMDWADDISYSIHDLEDFHRVGVIPWQEILDSKRSLTQDAFDNWFGASEDKRELLDVAFDSIKTLLEVSFADALLRRYDANREQRVALRTLTSQLTSNFLTSTKLSDGEEFISLDLTTEAQVKLLKQITKSYVISRPELVAQQQGQKWIIEQTFTTIYDNSADGYPKFLPPKFRYIREICGDNRARFASDVICSMAEPELVALHGRLFGSLTGSVLNPIIR